MISKNLNLKSFITSARLVSESVEAGQTGMINVDKYLFKKVLNASSSTAIEALYLETGLMPLRFSIISRRLMFYWSLLAKPDSELVKKVYNAQKIALM